MSIRLVEERCQTGTDWAIYEITVPCSWDWFSVIEIYCTVVDNRIDLTKPVGISIH